MIELIDFNNKKYARARSLHSMLGIKDNINTWFKKNVKRAVLESGLDFIASKQESTGGRPGLDYLVTKEAALSLIAISGGHKAKEVRLMLIKAFEQKQTGILLNADQVSALTDVVKAMTLVSVQDRALKKHFELFNKPKEWWQYRADLLGYSAESLKTALQQINKTYKNQRQALIHIDPSEIIRTGVVDLLIALGRGKEYALNVAEFAKIIAEKNGYCHKIWDDTKANPLGLNLPEIIERQKLNPLKL
jgi:phage anti-repressor protein